MCLHGVCAYPGINQGHPALDAGTPGTPTTKSGTHDGKQEGSEWRRWVLVFFRCFCWWWWWWWWSCYTSFFFLSSFGIVISNYCVFVRSFNPDTRHQETGPSHPETGRFVFMSLSRLWVYPFCCLQLMTESYDINFCLVPSPYVRPPSYDRLLLTYPVASQYVWSPPAGRLEDFSPRSPPCLESHGFQFDPTFLWSSLVLCLVLLLFLSSYFCYGHILLPFMSLNLVFSKDRLFRLALVFLFWSG